MNHRTHEALIVIAIVAGLLALATVLVFIVKDAVEHPCIERREVAERCRVKVQSGGYAESTCYRTYCVKYK